MNKKILSIFALIMALSFAVSCSNEETTGAKDPEPTVVTKDTIAAAVKSALGTTINVNTSDSKNMSTANTVVTLGNGTIDITITDATLNTASDGVKADAVASFTAKKDEFKAALVSQGLEVATGNITFAEGSDTTKTFNITVGGAQVSSQNTDATKFTLPDTLKNKATITITLKLVLGTSGTWA